MTCVVASTSVQVNTCDQPLQGMSTIESLDPRAFSDYLKQYHNTICGRHPIAVLLNVSHLRGTSLLSLHYRLKHTWCDSLYRQLTTCLLAGQISLADCGSFATTNQTSARVNQTVRSAMPVPLWSLPQSDTIYMSNCNKPFKYV